MLHFEIQVYGQKAVANELRGAAAKAPGAMQEATYRWAQTVRAALKAEPYPAKRPGQKYVRTGRMASSWRVDRRGKGVVISNSARGKSGQFYAGHVVGNAKGERQAWMHRGRWYLGKNVIDRHRPALKRDVVAELNRLFPQGRK